jgi:hypothetical protein
MPRKARRRATTITLLFFKKTISSHHACSVRDLPLPRAIAKPELRSELIIYMLLRLTFLPMLNFECDH